jgi:hypothetical protein
MPLSPPYPTIRERLRQGGVIPFLGSAASLSKRNPHVEWEPPEAAAAQPRDRWLPSANELARCLARQSSFPRGERVDLAKVAQYYEVVTGRKLLDLKLQEIFDCEQPVPALHTYLATLPGPLIIVTTNYDDLIERAFVGAGRPFDLVVHTVTEAGEKLLWWPYGQENPVRVLAKNLLVDLDKTTIIYKMHGTVDRRKAAEKLSQFVITEDDYIDFLSRMTNKTAIPAIFAQPFQTRNFLFLGYGLSDWNLRVVLNRIEKELRRKDQFVSWAIQKKPQLIEQKFWERRGVTVYNLTIEEFLFGLEKT